jgi:hypothetical protein
MKTWLVVVLSLIAGLGLGLGLTWAEFRGSDPLASLRESVESGPQIEAPEVAAIDARQSDGPIARVDDPTFDFGFMEINSDMTHEFQIANVGRAPLVLKKLATSCKCTMSKLADDKDEILVAPGDHAEITLAWHAAESGSEEFRQSATIKTNDPVLPLIKLTVQGKLTRSTGVTPFSLVFSTVSPSLGAKGEVFVYTYRDQPFEITGHAFEDETTAEYFQVEYSPVPAEKLGIAGAKHGCIVKVSLNPSAPLGPIQQRLILSTTLEFMPKVSVPITGKVVSDFSVAGRGWNSSREALQIGMVDSADGAERSLNLMVRGPGHEQTTFEVEKVEPELLKVELGAVTTSSGSSVTIAPLKIIVPKGCQPVNHMGSAVGPAAHVLLKTNRPEMPHVRIDVLFAVTR